jgi:hypothetical protein
MADDEFVPYSRKMGFETSKNIADNSAELARLIKGKQMEQESEEAKLNLANQLKEASRQKQLEDALSLRDKLGKDVSVDMGDIKIGGQDRMNDLIKMMQLQELEKEREERAVTKGAEDIGKTKVSEATEGLKRLENVSPGVISGQGELKSVGGWKNLVPNIFVPAAESLGVLPKGAAEERSAVQGLQNIQIHDLAGSAVSKPEQQRIDVASGLAGLFGNESAQKAIQQYAKKALGVAQTAEAGVRPSAKKTLEQRGLMGSQGIASLLGKAPKASVTGKEVIQKGGVTYILNPATGKYRKQ